MILSDYLNLIPQQHREKPKFIATVSTYVSSCIHIQDVMDSTLKEFDIDFAIGKQQDIVNEWIGSSRAIPIPITGLYFTWGDTSLTGWASGLWKSKFDPDTGIEVLNDTEFRRMMKAKTLSNIWKGNLNFVYNILFEAFFTAVQNTTVIDNGDMTMEVQTVGFSELDIDLLEQGIIILKPVGVGITFSHT
jgi:hypothetical protein